MDTDKIAMLSLKAEMKRAVEDFETWPEWAKEIPFENSDRIMESRIAEDAGRRQRSGEYRPSS